MALRLQLNREEVPEGYNVFTFGLKNALEKADENKNLGKMCQGLVSKTY